ncbi:hypothetical protein [Terrimonas pollutisoli]|uniref:hypothetical protein n=1 Tax=Terrimonas pollutisoli TaxID=3034147 RepID=UPI0023EBB88E|nr:hypothetical protein [Terrimonas sp. H1YJ31]
MSANFSLSQRLPVIKKSWDENARLYSLLFLVLLLLAVFTFWKPQDEGYYTSKQFETNEAAGDVRRSQADSESQYRSIVTNGDAIRSVFQ